MTNREQFEAWATRHEVNTMRVTVGDAYMTNAAYITWEAWEARGEVDAKRITELEERIKLALSLLDVNDYTDTHLMGNCITLAKKSLTKIKGE